MRIPGLVSEHFCNPMSAMRTTHVRVFFCCAAVVAMSCAPARTTTSPSPVATPPLAPVPVPPPTGTKLPPVPEVRGPLQIDVVYPKADQLLTTRDSNFIFGSV